MKRLKIILQSKHLFKIIALIILLLDIIYLETYPFTSKYNQNEEDFTLIIKDYTQKEDKIILYLKGKETLISYYPIPDQKQIKLSYGDKLKIKGKLQTPSPSTTPNTFNYQKYLNHKRIYYILEITSIEKITPNKNYLYTIKNLLNKRVSHLKSSSYIQTLILCKNTLDKEIKESYRKNGISHLFSVSGMHINFFLAIIYSYLNKITYNKKLKHRLANIFLIIYLTLYQSSSLLRSTIMTLIYTTSQIHNIKIPKINILLLTLIISIIINPFIIYDLGYIYSYIITFFLILSGKTIKNKTKLTKIIHISIISFIISLPINIYINYEINILSIIINIILVPIISTIILPLTILTLVIPIFDRVLYTIMTLIEKISLTLSTIQTFTIILPKPPLIIIIIYYLILILIYTKTPKYYLPLLGVLISIYISPYLNPNPEVTTLDVGEADSHLIKYPHNQNNILIDTGKEKYHTENIIIPYLKSKGIKKINYLIITHGDTDHIGGAISLINNYRVDKVILNCGSYNNLEKELIKTLNKKKIKYYTCIKNLTINKNKLYFLNTKDYNNENNNSNVIYTKLNNYKFLFMGDAEIEKEKDILDKYNISDIDILKVGHHGSKTSSSSPFINKVNPKYSIISVGKNNNYGHPNQEVLNNLKKSKIYRTDKDGTIEIKITKNTLKIKTSS